MEKNSPLLFKALCESYEFSLRALDHAVKIKDTAEAEKQFDKVGYLLKLVREEYLLKAFCAKYPDHVYKLIDHILITDMKKK